jgi:hypothetical protein
MRRIARAIALGSSFAAKASNSTGGVTDLRSGPAVLSCSEEKPDVRSNEEGGAVAAATWSSGRSISGAGSEILSPPLFASSMRRSSIAKRRRRPEISATSSWEKGWRPAFSRTSTRPMMRPSK